MHYPIISLWLDYLCPSNTKSIFSFKRLKVGMSELQTTHPRCPYSLMLEIPYLARILAAFLEAGTHLGLQQGDAPLAVELLAGSVILDW